MPVETCQKYTATLSEILALTPVVQTIADATDVPGVRLEWMNGAWYGDCGFPSAAQHSALLAANAYNSLALGAKATISGVQYTWQGAAGWVPALNRLSDAVVVGSIGDSITWYGGGVALHACTQSGGRARFIKNGGVPGENSTQILARLNQQLIGYPCQVLILGMVTNDARAAVPVATFKANVNAAIDICSAKGVAPVFLTGAPNNESSTIRNAIIANNIALETICRTRGLLLSHRWDAINDGTFQFKSGTSQDAIHPKTQYLAAEGLGLYNEMLAFGLIPAQAMPAVYAPADTRNLFTNATLTIDTNADGLADGITNIGGFTASLSASSVLGNKQVATLTANASAVGPRINYGSVVAGGKYRARVFGSVTVSSGTALLQYNNPYSPANAYNFRNDASAKAFAIPVGTYNFVIDEVFTASATGVAIGTVYDDASGATLVLSIERISFIDLGLYPEFA